MRLPPMFLTQRHVGNFLLEEHRIRRDQEPLALGAQCNFPTGICLCHRASPDSDSDHGITFWLIKRLQRKLFIGLPFRLPRDIHGGLFEQSRQGHSDAILVASRLLWHTGSARLGIWGLSSLSLSAMISFGQPFVW